MKPHILKNKAVVIFTLYSISIKLNVIQPKLTQARVEDDNTIFPTRNQFGLKNKHDMSKKCFSL